MSDWRIFKGEHTAPHDDIRNAKRFPSAPKWRQFGDLPKGKVSKDNKYWRALKNRAQDNRRDWERGQKLFIRSCYAQANSHADDERLKEYARVIDTVNAALYLRRPLLVTGQPGSGKTSLAYAIAYQLQLGPVLVWPVTTRSVLQDGLYQYDAIARLRDSQLDQKNKSAEVNSAESGDDNLVQAPSQPAVTHQDIGNYIRLGPIGTAFVASRYPRVLLIDEIDKSDINLPNDLLNLFEEGAFNISELKRLAKQGKRVQTVTTEDDLQVNISEGQVQCSAFPLVVMTSNGERDFPPAFLRRCLRVRMPDPDKGDLQAIVKAHLEDEQIYNTFEEDINKYIDRFLDRRDDSDGGTIATDQLLNTIYLLTQSVDEKDVDELENVLLKPLTSQEDSA